MSKHRHRPDEPLRYFVPGELIVEVKHSGDFSRTAFLGNPVFGREGGPADRLLKALDEQNINEKERKIIEKAQSDALKILSDEDEQWVSAALGESEPFLRGSGTSYVRLKIKKLARDGAAHRDTANETLIYLAGELELRAKDPDLQRGNEQPISGVCLNWLWSSAPDNQTSGGPGSLPVVPNGKIGKDDYKFTVWDPGISNLESKQQATETMTAARGKLVKQLDREQSDYCPIDVIILDTIPPEETLKNISVYQNKCLDDLLQHLSGNLHYYEKDLRKEDEVFKYIQKGFVGGLKRQVANFLHTMKLPVPSGLGHPYEIKHHEYNMSDHGLFIAGIIHQIAPRARIHMIEVLNENGVGSLPSLIWGLVQIIDRHNLNSPLIINSSLTICFSSATLKSGKETSVEAFLSLLERLENAINLSLSSIVKNRYAQISNPLSNSKALSVAASGNDMIGSPSSASGNNMSSSPSGTPGITTARFPAAYEDVIGVGALTKAGGIAPYSNKPDERAWNGLYAFGGDVAKWDEPKKKWIADQTKGMIGLYTHDVYPDGTKNEYGWARWAGTSFASAVATGIAALAYTYKDGVIDPTDPQDVIKWLHDLAEELTTTEAHILPVRQGKP